MKAAWKKGGCVEFCRNLANKKAECSKAHEKSKKLCGVCIKNISGDIKSIKEKCRLNDKEIMDPGYLSDDLTDYHNDPNAWKDFNVTSGCVAKLSVDNGVIIMVFIFATMKMVLRMWR